MDFKLYPEILTERLVLRKLNYEDSELIFTLRSSKEVTKYIERPLYKSIDEAKTFITDRLKDIDNNISIVWAICIRGSVVSIGTICLWNFSEDKKKAEVGYDLLPQFQGNGFMNEALKSVIDFGFNKLNLSLIDAYTDIKNKSSIRLLERNQFILNKNRKDEENSNNVIFELHIK